MNWSCNIEKVENGYILKSRGEDSEAEVFEATATDDDYERFKTTDDDKVALGKLLERVAEHFGELYDKWKDDNLEITFSKKGSKVD